MEVTQEVIQENELEHRGAKLVNSSILVLDGRQYRIGPCFATKWKQKAHDLCQRLKKLCILVESANYISIWVQSEQTPHEANKRRRDSKPPTRTKVPQSKSNNPPITSPEMLKTKHLIPQSGPVSTTKNIAQTNPTIAKKPASAHPASVSYSAPVSLARDQNLRLLDQTFISSCRSALIEMIGPMGDLFVSKVLTTNQSEKKRLTTQQFIKLLANEIPDPEKATEFRKRFIP